MLPAAAVLAALPHGATAVFLLLSQDGGIIVQRTLGTMVLSGMGSL